MLRIRKEEDVAKIVIRIEKECAIEDVPKTLDTIHDEIEEGSALITSNIPHFDEVKIDNQGDMTTKKKYVTTDKKDATPDK